MAGRLISTAEEQEHCHDSEAEDHHRFGDGDEQDDRAERFGLFGDHARPSRADASLRETRADGGKPDGKPRADGGESRSDCGEVKFQVVSFFVIVSP